MLCLAALRHSLLWMTFVGPPNPQQPTRSRQSRTNWNLMANATWGRLCGKNGSWLMEGTNRAISSDGKDGAGNMTSRMALTTWRTQWSRSTRSTTSTLGLVCLQGRRPGPSQRSCAQTSTCEPATIGPQKSGSKETGRSVATQLSLQDIFRDPVNLARSRNVDSGMMLGGFHYCSY
jgi:hypothetical protein